MSSRDDVSSCKWNGVKCSSTLPCTTPKRPFNIGRTRSPILQAVERIFTRNWMINDRFTLKIQITNAHRRTLQLLTYRTCWTHETECTWLDRQAIVLRIQIVSLLPNAAGLCLDCYWHVIQVARQFERDRQHQIEVFQELALTGKDLELLLLYSWQWDDRSTTTKQEKISRKSCVFRMCS